LQKKSLTNLSQTYLEQTYDGAWALTDTPTRSLAKAVTWRMTGTIDTFAISWLITGELLLASGIAVTEILTKIVLFWLHERAWNRIGWGRN
jgi:uncharacterized membrane protein